MNTERCIDYPIQPRYVVLLFQLREVALDYFDCANSSVTRQLIQTSIDIRWHSVRQHLHLLDECRKQVPKAERKGSSKPRVVHTAHCCISVLIRTSGASADTICDVCVDWLGCAWLDKAARTLNTTCCLNHCTYMLHNPWQLLTVGCRPSTQQQMDIHLPTSSADPYVQTAQKSLTDRQCHHLKVRRQFGWLPVLNIPTLGLVQRKEAPSMSGLGCPSNMSLHFYVMDTQHHHMFPHRLGLNLGLSYQLNNNSIAVIIDKQVSHNISHIKGLFHFQMHPEGDWILNGHLPMQYEFSCTSSHYISIFFCH